MIGSIRAASVKIKKLVKLLSKKNLISKQEEKDIMDVESEEELIASIEVDDSEDMA